MKFEVKGIKELDIKITRFANFLGKEYKNGMLEIAKYVIKRFKFHINHHRTQAGRRYKVMTPGRLDLESEYKDRKQKKYGKIYPILRASDKMYNDVKYFIGVSWKVFRQGNKIKLSFGFKTNRSELIAGYHNEGIQSKKGLKIRDPWFITSGEQSWITNNLRKRTRKALRKARLK